MAWSISATMNGETPMTIKLLYEKLATNVAMPVPVTEMATAFHAFIYHQMREAIFVFFYVGLFSRTFTNHRTAGEGGKHFINSSLPLPPASQTLRRWLRPLLQIGHLCT